jgi:hypothetical protein
LDDCCWVARPGHSAARSDHSFDLSKVFAFLDDRWTLREHYFSMPSTVPSDRGACREGREERIELSLGGVARKPEGVGTKLIEVRGEFLAVSPPLFKPVVSGLPQDRVSVPTDPEIALDGAP